MSEQQPQLSTKIESQVSVQDLQLYLEDTCDSLKEKFSSLRQVMIHSNEYLDQFPNSNITFFLDQIVQEMEEMEQSIFQLCSVFSDLINCVSEQNTNIILLNDQATGYCDLIETLKKEKENCYSEIAYLNECIQIREQVNENLNSELIYKRAELRDLHNSIGSGLHFTNGIEYKGPELEIANSNRIEYSSFQKCIEENQAFRLLIRNLESETESLKRNSNVSEKRKAYLEAKVARLSNSLKLSREGSEKQEAILKNLLNNQCSFRAANNPNNQYTSEPSNFKVYKEIEKSQANPLLNLKNFSLMRRTLNVAGKHSFIMTKSVLARRIMIENENAECLKATRLNAEAIMKERDYFYGTPIVEEDHKEIDDNKSSQIKLSDALKNKKAKIVKLRSSRRRIPNKTFSNRTKVNSIKRNKSLKIISEASIQVVGVQRKHLKLYPINVLSLEIKENTLNHIYDFMNNIKTKYLSSTQSPHISQQKEEVKLLYQKYFIKEKFKSQGMLSSRNRSRTDQSSKPLSFYSDSKEIQSPLKRKPTFPFQLHSQEK